MRTLHHGNALTNGVTHTHFSDIAPVRNPAGVERKGHTLLSFRS